MAFREYLLFGGMSGQDTAILLEDYICRDGNGDRLIRRITEIDREILTDLGLMPRITEIKNPRGRPRKVAKC